MKLCNRAACCAALVVTSGMVLADGFRGHHGGPHIDQNELNLEIETFNIGDSKSIGGDAVMSATGIRLESEYEMKNGISFAFGYELWRYNWSSTLNMPFAPGTTATPWSEFTTYQFGMAYEHEYSDQWEFNYYIEAETSFEKEMANSNEYELGADFSYEHSKSWTTTINVNYEYLDAEGAELGLDLEIEWNDHATEGWSGEFEISSEFPESMIRYHFNSRLSAAVFYGDGGTNTIRLSDTSPLPGLQGGYLEDEYTTIGFRVDYGIHKGGKLSFNLQQNSNRLLSFQRTGVEEDITYQFEDSVEFFMRYTLEFYPD